MKLLIPDSIVNRKKNCAIHLYVPETHLIIQSTWEDEGHVFNVYTYSNY